MEFLRAYRLHRRAQLVDGRHSLKAVPPLEELLRFLLKQLLSLPGHGLTGFLVTGNDLLKVIHIVGFNAVHIGNISSDVARHPDINQAKLAAPVQRSQTRGIDDRIICGGTGEHQRAGAQILIQIRERPALNRKIGEISRQLFGPFNGAVQQNNTGGTFGLKVLKQQTAHAPGTDNGDLLAFQGDQLIKSPGLTKLELGELNGR